MTMEWELLKNAVKKPATQLYPNEKPIPIEGIRAMISWNIERCIGCGLCPKTCPSEAIEMVGKEMDANITYYLERCIFCGECVDICPTKAIETTTKYELAFFTRDEMVIHFKRSKNRQMTKNQHL